MTAPAVLLEWNPQGTLLVDGRRRRARRWFVGILLGALTLIVSIPAAAAAEVYRWSGVHDPAHTDAIVVLGAAQYQGAPSPVLANRLAHARELYSSGVAPTVITVGGFQPGDISSEAQTGKEELIADGLPSRAVIALPFGGNTSESMQDVATIALSQGITSITIVTDPAHAARARAMAAGLGLDAHVSTTVSGPGAEITGEYLLRETAGLIDVWFDR